MRQHELVSTRRSRVANLVVFVVSTVITFVIVGLFGGPASGAEHTPRGWATASGATWHQEAVGAAGDVALGGDVERVGDWVVTATWSASGPTESDAIVALGPAPAATMTVAAAAVESNGVWYAGAVGLRYVTPVLVPDPVTETTTPPLASSSTVPAVTASPVSTTATVPSAVAATDIVADVVTAPAPAAVASPVTEPGPTTTARGGGRDDAERIVTDDDTGGGAGIGSAAPPAAANGISTLAVAVLVVAVAVASGVIGRLTRRR